MTTYYAQPYDLAANGFYFDDETTFERRIRSAKNRYGQPVEEFEIQFIDGDAIDCELAEAWSINQANIRKFMERVDDWDDERKTRFILAVGECGYDFDPDTVDPDAFEVDIYTVDSVKDLAEHIVDEGLFGDTPERLQFYLDFDAIARDLSVDYNETTIAGQHVVYRCC